MVSAHRSSKKSGHKPFKSKHATKGSLKKANKGKIEKDSSPNDSRHSNSNTQKLAAGSKQIKKDRKNKANQVKSNKNTEIAIHKQLFEGKNGAPKMIAVIPLCDDCNPAEAIVQINDSVEATVGGAVPTVGIVDANMERFKQHVKYIIPNRKNFVEILDCARVADFVIFLLSPNQEVDEFGELCIRSIESQGVSNTIPLISNITSVGNIKKQTDVRGSLLSFFAHFFPSTEKIFAPDVTSEALNVARLLCQKFPQGISWRDSRSYMLADDVQFDEDSQCVAVEGVLRGQGLNPDRLVHIPEFGDFQIEKVEGLQKNIDAMDTDDNILAQPSENQETLEELAPVEEGNDDDDMNDFDSREQTAVRMDGYDYMKDISDDESDDEVKKLQKPRNLPQGMSAYQASWIFDEDLEDEEGEQEGEEEGAIEVEEENNNDNDDDDEDMDTMDIKNDGRKRVTFAESAYAPTEGTEMHQELSNEEEARQLKEFRDQFRQEQEWPDEVELRPEETGRERLKRYRAVKNLRNSDWDPYEKDDRTPQDWNRLARVPNFKATRNRVLKEGITQSQVQPGSKIKLFIKAPKLVVEQAKQPFVIYGLLHHEHQQAVMNYTISPNTEYDFEKTPVAAKEELIMQCGPRRMIVRPLYSQSGNNSPNGVYKYERFLHPGQPSTATVIAPLTFGNVPVLFFRENGTPVPDLVGTGSVLDANANRVLAKRAVLTGHAIKIHKKLVTIRYMFFNPEDVLWFKAVPLFTKSGRTGFIKESLGTHGYFKATFDGKMTSQDVVGMALYKRIWPRYSTMWSTL